MITAPQIVRCCKSDRGTSIRDLELSADYCEQISRNAALNPWADSGDASAYSEAARVLRTEAERLSEAMFQSQVELGEEY